MDHYQAYKKYKRKYKQLLLARSSEVRMRGGAEENQIPAVVVYTIRQMEAGATAMVLNDNRIGDEGARALADGLRENETVTAMWLSRIGIGDGGARALADALREIERER